MNEFSNLKPYNGNPNLKRVNQSISWTPDLIQEYLRCKNDIIYFVKTYMKIINLDQGLINLNLYDYQERMIKSFVDNRFNIVSTSRQAGKTTTTCAFVLWYILFNSDKTVALLANKGETAREILGKIQLAYQHLPKWLQQGSTEWNKGSLELENNSRVIASATSSNNIRGFSCVSSDTKICLENNDNVYYVKIAYLLNNSGYIEEKESAMKYVIYETKNSKNNKIYVGFHRVPFNSVVKDFSRSGSIFEDGYLGSGKLLVRSVAKNGPESFDQRLLETFNTQQEAENYEKLIVDAEFTLREDTYNLSVGGSVLIMYGKNNPFFGKTHSEETKEIISKAKSGNKDFSLKYDCKIIHVDTGKVYLDFVELKKDYKDLTKKKLYFDIGEGKFRYSDNSRQQKAIDYCRSLLSKEERSKILGDLAKKRFSGIPLSAEQKEKIGDGVRLFIKEHPEEHIKKMLKINKNPEKIKKTAEKHRGMKRSDETKKKLSEVQRNNIKNNGVPNKGKLVFHNEITKEVITLFPEEHVPEGFVRGHGKSTKEKGKIRFHNPLNYEIISLNPGDQVPEGYIRGYGKRR